MHSVTESSDTALLDLLRQRGSLGVAELASAMQVTATAVRQRLARLMADGLIERDVARAARAAEPSLFADGEGAAEHGLQFRRSGNCPVERSAADQGSRDSQRAVAAHWPARWPACMAAQFAATRPRSGWPSVSRLLGERNVPFAVDRSGQLPVLTALACPYPELAEQDRGICAVEKILFSELVGEKVRLTECRLDGSEQLLPV